jgi:hypothetical protein
MSHVLGGPKNSTALSVFAVLALGFLLCLTVYFGLQWRERAEISEATLRTVFAGCVVDLNQDAGLPEPLALKVCDATFQRWLEQGRVPDLSFGTEVVIAGGPQL